MKNYKISEILYWVIAVVATYECYNQWNGNRQKAYIFIGFALLQSLWHSLEDTTRKSLTKGEIPLNDHL